MKPEVGEAHEEESRQHRRTKSSSYSLREQEGAKTVKYESRNLDQVEDHRFAVKNREKYLRQERRKKKII